MNDLLLSENIEDRKLGCRIFIKNREWENADINWQILDKNDQDFNYYECATLEKTGDKHTKLDDVLYIPNINDNFTLPNTQIVVAEVKTKGVSVFRMEYKHLSRFISHWRLEPIIVNQ